MMRCGQIQDITRKHWQLDLQTDSIWAERGRFKNKLHGLGLNGHWVDDGTIY